MITTPYCHWLGSFPSFVAASLDKVLPRRSKIFSGRDQEAKNAHLVVLYGSTNSLICMIKRFKEKLQPTSLPWTRHDRTSKCLFLRGGSLETYLKKSKE